MSRQGHYFAPTPQVAHRRRTVTVTLRGRDFEFITDRGVFAAVGLDRGSRLLIDAMPVDEDDVALDLGCGYGAVGLVAAALAPRGHAHLVDINERATELARENAALNGLANVTVHTGAGTAPVAGVAFDVVLTNPPIRAGRATVLAFFAGAHEALRPGGRFLFVARTSQGAKTLARQAAALFEEVSEIERGGGFRVFECVKVAAGE